MCLMQKFFKCLQCTFFYKKSLHWPRFNLFKFSVFEPIFFFFFFFLIFGVLGLIFPILFLDFRRSEAVFSYSSQYFTEICNQGLKINFIKIFLSQNLLTKSFFNQHLFLANLSYQNFYGTNIL